VLGILANPSYAGTYVFGRHQSCKQIGPTGEIQTQSRLMPQDEWRVVLHDHHPGYITWDQFLANRQRLAANRTNLEVLAGPVREGLCLLQGLLLCGACGRRLGVRYTGNGGLYPIYQCVWKHREGLESHACLSTPSKPLDDAIVQRLLTAVTPLSIKLALEALTSLEERDKMISAQRLRRIERARYDVDLAERRYEEADPSNRLVASTLEKRWNDAMQRLLELEAELADFERHTVRSITVEQKQQILQLGRDFPRLWKAPTTAASDRKRMLRLLISDITVVKGPDPKLLRLQIRWQGGATETIEVRQRPNRADAVRYPEAFVAKIRALAERHADKEIAVRLNAEGLTSSTGKSFTASMISWIRFKHRIPGPSHLPGTLTVNEVRARYGVSMHVVYYWIAHGIVAATQRETNTPYAITINDNVDRRLQKWVANSGHLHPSSQTRTA
jgi:Recombinase zinc beta ribbon domain/Recombinase